MAYDTGDILVTVRGNLDPGEIWTNTWTFVEVTPGSTPQDVVDDLHAFYAGLAAEWFASEWTSVGAVIKDLASGVSVEAAWESLTGANVQDILPTQLAIRLSLSDEIGTRGGPFLPGWAKQASAEDGVIDSGVVTDLIAAVGTLDTDATANGYRIGIHRPSVPDVRVATVARVGERFDVIRKRANALSEGYTSTALV